MVIAIDIGNTNIVLGAYRDDTLLFHARLATERVRTDYQYAAEIDAILRMYRLRDETYEMCIRDRWRSVTASNAFRRSPRVTDFRTMRISETRAATGTAASILSLIHI